MDSGGAVSAAGVFDGTIRPIIAVWAAYGLTANGDFLSVPLSLSGAVIVGLLYGLTDKTRNPDSTYRVHEPLLSLISTFVPAWLLLCVALTIKNPRWFTRWR